MPTIKIVMDVVKPLKEPNIFTLAYNLLEINGVKSVNIKVQDVSADALALLIEIVGSNIEFEKVKLVLEEVGATINSVNEVSLSKE